MRSDQVKHNYSRLEALLSGIEVGHKQDWAAADKVAGVLRFEEHHASEEDAVVKGTVAVHSAVGSPDTLVAEADGDGLVGTAEAEDTVQTVNTVRPVDTAKVADSAGFVGIAEAVGVVEDAAAIEWTSQQTSVPSSSRCGGDCTFIRIGRFCAPRLKPPT